MPQPLPLTDRAVVHDLLGKPLACPLEVVDAEIVPLAGLVAAMGAVALAGDQFDLPVAVDVPGACGLDIANLRDDALGPLLRRIP